MHRLTDVESNELYTYVTPDSTRYFDKSRAEPAAKCSAQCVDSRVMNEIAL